MFAFRSTTLILFRRYSVGIGIRREGKNRWERRVPLTPLHVKHLIANCDAKVYIQPCTKRTFTDEEFTKVRVPDSDIILGVKEVPISDLIANKTYLFFSHTHKGQSYNMKMLKTILDRNITLIDYELMADEKRGRLVLFGTFAGYSGMINALNGLGDRFLALGYSTQFLNVGLTHHYLTLNHAKEAVRELGSYITMNGTPRELGPMIFVFTGNGNVSKGAQEIFKLLPHHMVSADELQSLAQSKVTAKDYLKYTGKFDMKHFLENPHTYESIYHEKIAPYATMIVNGIYWDPKFPRLITTQQMEDLYKNGCRLISIADISCDINGSLEFMDRATSIDHPFYIYDPVEKVAHQDGVKGKGVQIMSVDILPSQLPREASEYFGNALIPFVSELLKGNYKHPILQGATITSKGELTERHRELTKRIESVLFNTARKKILVLGSGYVSLPLVDYLHRQESYEITIASNNLEEAKTIAKKRPRISVDQLDINDKATLETMVGQHDIVVSFIPATLHPIVAEACINSKVDMVTASYVSPQIAALNDKATQAGIVIMNEIGLDPGIDHLTAMKIIDTAKESGHNVSKFISWCCGLPAPENSDNPLGYKFSWSPRGVLLAGMNSASYKWDGKMVNIEGKDLLKSAKSVNIYNGFNFEGYPNRDSLKYLDVYGLKKEEMTTMFRGTIRYKGYSSIMSCFADLGLLNSAECTIGEITWKQLLMKQIGCESSETFIADLEAFLLSKNQSRSKDDVHQFINALHWFGVLDQLVPVTKSLLDSLCTVMTKTMGYAAGERDMVCLHHEFEILRGDGTTEQKTSTLIAYGTPGGYTAMAKTVGLPAAIAAKLILQGDIPEKGVQVPTKRHVYEKILEALEGEGIKFHEKSVISKNNKL